MIAVLLAAMAVTPTPDVATLLANPPTIGRSCGYWQLQPTDTKIRAKAQRLGDLPPAHQELSVLRWDENGCSKAVVVRRNVNGDGRFANPR
jgi:hypothetical protein